jgi:hypothetical protein
MYMKSDSDGNNMLSADESKQEMLSRRDTNMGYAASASAERR